MNRNRLSYAVTAMGLSVLVWACGGGDSAEAPANETPAAETPQEAAQEGLNLANVTLPEGVTAEMVNAGQAMYPTQVCTACHGMGTPTGGALAPNLADDEWLNSDGSYEGIVNSITDGVMEPKQFASPMPPKGGAVNLTDEQVRELAAYIYALSHGAS